MRISKFWLIIVMFAVLAVPAMAGLVAEYTFDNTLNDETGSCNLANTMGTVTYSNTESMAFNDSGTTAPTYVGSWDGGDVATTSCSDIQNVANDYTISVWLKTSTYTLHDTPYMRGYWSNQGAFAARLLSGGGWTSEFYTPSSPRQTACTTENVQDGNWHMITARFNESSNDLDVYVDGVLCNSVTQSSNNQAYATTFAVGGRPALDRRITGFLSSMHFYDDALNTTAIRNLYNYNNISVPAPSGPPQVNITAYDAETAVQINTFNATLNGTFLSTTNGTIHHNVTGSLSTVVEANGYITLTTTYTYSDGQQVQWNLTKTNRNITLYAGNNYGDALSTFNVSVDGDAPLTTTGGSITTEVDRTVLHNLTFTAPAHEPFTFTGFNASSNTTYNATLTSNLVYVDFDATDDNSTALTDFNLTLNGVTYAVATNKTFFLDNSDLYNVTFSKANYFNDVHTNYNISTNLTGNLTEHFRIVVGTETFVPGTEGNASFSYLNFSTNLDDVTGIYDWTAVGATINAEYPTFNTSGSGAPNSLLFDGVNDQAYGNLSFLGVEVTDQLSYNYWFKTNQTATVNIQSWRSGNYNNLFTMTPTGDATFSYFDRNATTSVVNVQLVVNVSGINDNNWHMVTVVVDDTAGSISFYYDATLVHTQTGLTFDVEDLSAITGTDINWGNRQWVGDRYYSGHLDEFQVFNHSLDQTNINALYNVNYVEGSGGSWQFSNTTNQYSVNWNSSTYSPNAENKTYLPVRYTLESFTIDPFSTEFKQIAKTNYNTTYHLTTTFNNSHAVTATNRYDSSSISNFTVVVGSNSYTANGTTAYLQNETGTENYIVTHPSYFNVTALNVNVTNGSSSVLMHQAEVRFNGTQRFTNTTVTDGNVTIGAVTNAFGEPFYLNVGNYTAQYSSVNDEAEDLNFTFSALQNVTETITNITNANLTVVGTNAVDGTAIPFFTSSVSNDTLFISFNQTKTSPHLYNLIQNVTYNVVFDNTSFALGDVNLTLLNRSTLYNFTVFTTNSFNISILNELTQDQITNTNFSVEFIGNYASYNYTYDGSLYADLVVPDQYQIRYNWINGSGAVDFGQLRQYHFLLTNRTHNPLDLYAINKSESTEIEITVQNGNTLIREEGVIVKLQRFYIGTNSYETVAMYETDSQGQAYFDVEANDELYKFVVDSPLGTSVYTSTPQYLQETEYTIFIDTSQDPIATYVNNAGLSVTVTYNATGSTTTYNDPQVSAGEYEFKVFERGPYADTEVSSATATTTSGALVNTYAFENGTSYYGVFYRDAVAEASFDFVDFLETNGLPALGLFLTSILFVVAVFISAFSLYSVIIASIALVASNMMGLITISTPIIGAVVVGAIILAIILEWRRG